MPNNEQKRTGETTITSVSVSKEFSEIIKKNNLSPTDIFRKGFVIEAWERDIEIPFLSMNSPTIQERLKRYKEVKEMLLFQNLDEKLLDMEVDIAKLREEFIKIKKVLE